MCIALEDATKWNRRQQATTACQQSLSCTSSSRRSKQSYPTLRVLRTSPKRATFGFRKDIRATAEQHQDELCMHLHRETERTPRPLGRTNVLYCHNKSLNKQQEQEQKEEEWEEAATQLPSSTPKPNTMPMPMPI
ncbi:hypothetical protein ACLKA7_012188 [Drosophila subpalustris]